MVDLDPRQFQTYSIRQPIATHFRPATCAEVDCAAYLNGWVSDVDDSSPLGVSQAVYIRQSSGRRFTEERLVTGNLRFTFEAGQRCFGGQHQVSLERPAIYIARDGDARGNPTGRRRIHTSPEEWVEDFSEHQARVAKDRS